MVALAVCAIAVEGFGEWFVAVRLPVDLCAATVQQPEQHGTGHRRNEFAVDWPKLARLSHAYGHTRTRPERPCRLCTAEVRGSNLLGSTLRTKGSASKTQNVSSVCETLLAFCTPRVH